MSQTANVDAILAAAKQAGITDSGDLVAFALGFSSATKAELAEQDNNKEGGATVPQLPQGTRPAMPKDELKAAFKALYPRIVERLQNDPIVTDVGMPAKVRDWVKRLCDYNVPHGKMNRGMICMQAAHVLGADTEQAALLGWCIEMMQAAFLVADDIMDASEMRRAQACWYKLKDIGLNAINDSWILLAFVYRMHELFCADQPHYQHTLKILKETEFRTELGQFLDLTSGEAENEVQPDLFTDETYGAIVKYKTAYYTFYGPIALGMAAAGITDERAYKEAESILMKIGTYFQIQDDYLDCFGTPEQIGKVGRDIEENKCGWLVVQALKLVNEDQMAILKENYAQEDPEKVAKVKALYRELKLPQKFKKFEEDSYKTISAEIAETKFVPAEVFSFALKAIYKRDY